MGKVTRREAIMSIVATGSTIAGLSNNANAKETESGGNESYPPAFRGEHKPKPLPFDSGKLVGISEKLIRSHWENNYVGSVNALNKVERRLMQLQEEENLPGFVYGDLKREELIRTGSVVLHEQYFANLGGNGKADGEVEKAVANAFGNFQRWEAEFVSTAGSLSGGSGWTILAFNLHTKQLHNYWASDHSQNSPNSVPLLVLDMYEHSYHMDYGSAAAKYVAAFMQNVNWDEVNRRYTGVKNLAVRAS